jgi:hypothetical protein
MGLHFQKGGVQRPHSAVSAKASNADITQRTTKICMEKAAWTEGNACEKGIQFARADPENVRSNCDH